MTKYDGHQLRWGLGNCSNDDETYKDYMTYDRICCVEPRRYTLTCKNTLKPHGWKRGYIEILGRRYCDDFMGYSAFRSLDIIGKNKHYRYRRRLLFVDMQVWSKLYTV